MGAMFTFALIFFPRTPSAFAIALIGEKRLSRARHYSFDRNLIRNDRTRKSARRHDLLLNGIGFQHSDYLHAVR